VDRSFSDWSVWYVACTYIIAYRVSHRSISLATRFLERAGSAVFHFQAFPTAVGTEMFRDDRTLQYVALVTMRGDRASAGIIEQWEIGDINIRYSSARWCAGTRGWSIAGDGTDAEEGSVSWETRCEGDERVQLPCCPLRASQLWNSEESWKNLPCVIYI
jgi:hypothetical protein